ncbi:unnamed protein product [Camellia sinensis]
MFYLFIYSCVLQDYIIIIIIFIFFYKCAGLYYDGNNGVWYSYDHQTQQYVPYSDQSDNETAGKQNTYTETELDEVRVEWINFVLKNMS